MSKDRPVKNKHQRQRYGHEHRKTRIQFHHNHFIASYLRELNSRCGVYDMHDKRRWLPFHTCTEILVYVCLCVYVFSWQLIHIWPNKFYESLWVVNCVYAIRAISIRIECMSRAIWMSEGKVRDMDVYAYIYGYSVHIYVLCTRTQWVRIFVILNKVANTNTHILHMYTCA